ncbi:hypothetical protein EI94DRAFT_975052 [Lactarius quietus]|nr:hypothetical protein EI94DRAFT_975052 [Lactarius quietus]
MKWRSLSLLIIAGMDAALCVSETKTSGASVLCLLCCEINMANSGAGCRPDSFPMIRFSRTPSKSGLVTLRGPFISDPCPLPAVGRFPTFMAPIPALDYTRTLRDERHIYSEGRAMCRCVCPILAKPMITCGSQLSNARGLDACCD